MFARSALRALPRAATRRSYTTAPDPVWTEPGSKYWWLFGAGVVGVVTFIVSNKDSHMKNLELDNERQRPFVPKESKWGSLRDGKWGKDE